MDTRALLNKRGRRLLVAAVGLVWALSLCLDVVRLGGDQPRTDGPGLLVLALGWLGIFVGEFDWLANPALIFLMLIVWDDEHYPRVSWLLLGTVMTFLIKNVFRNSWTNGTAPDPLPIESFGFGFYFWMAALAFGFVVGLISVLKPEWIGKPRNASARKPA